MSMHLKRPLQWLMISLALVACGALMFSLTALADKPDTPGKPGGEEPLFNPAFVYLDFADFGVFLTTVDGSATQRLTKPKGKAVDNAPVWSPDGSLIAFLRRPDHTKVWTDLYTINSGGSGLTLVRSFDSDPMPADGGNYQTLAWSPDGSRIIYASNGSVFGASLWAVTVPGGNLEPVLADPRFRSVADPSFSPDLDTAEGYQGLLAFTATTWPDPGQHPVTDLWMVEVTTAGGGLTTGQVSQLTFNDVPGIDIWEAAPAFAPDGVHIAYTAYAEDADTRQTISMEIRVLNLLGDDWFVTDIGSTFPEPRWSPDGQHLGFDESGDLYRVSPWDPSPTVVRVTDTAAKTEAQPDWNPAWLKDIDP
jgi:Tol biopolymer transport system component